MTDAQLSHAFDVNVFGQVRVTRALLDLLRLARGRIVNICSIGGHIAMPFIGPLAASKFAMEAVNDVLRMELQAFGVRVIAVEPASIKTRAVQTMEESIQQTVAAMSTENRGRYGAAFSRAMRTALEREHHGSPPEVVATAVYKALTDRKPRTRYFAGKDATILRLLAKMLPDEALDTVRLRVMGLR